MKGILRGVRAGDVLRSLSIVVLTAIAAVVAALAVSTQTAPEFTVSSSYVIGPAGDAGEADAQIRSLDGLQRAGVVATFVELIVSAGTVEQASEAAGVRETAVGDYRVVATVLSESNVVEVTVTGPDPAAAAALARALGPTATELFTDTYGFYQVRSLDESPEDAESTAASLLRVVVVALGMGLLVGSGLAIWWHRARAHRRLSGSAATAQATTPLPS